MRIVWHGAHDARMTKTSDHDDNSTGDKARAQLLTGMPVTERRLQLAGVSTAVLEGGDGPPVMLLHEQGEFAARWMRVIPDLVTTNRVVAPDLPGHGSSQVIEGKLDAERVMSWLDELIERTCPSPPVLVGHMLGGAIAARFAVDHADRLKSLVLVDSFGLHWFRPTPKLALALVRYIGRPSERTFDRLYQHCAVDLDGMRNEIGERWDPFRAYVVDRARTPGLKAAMPILMRKFAIRAIPPAALAQITVPTTLIWGRHDPATKLRVAEAASARYGWPLHVIEDAADDPVLEQPDATLRALRAAIAS
jgi:pimeloyl-ACP methyl ester carboxylesterase